MRASMEKKERTRSMRLSNDVPKESRFLVVAMVGSALNIDIKRVLAILDASAARSRSSCPQSLLRSQIGTRSHLLALSIW